MIFLGAMDPDVFITIAFAGLVAVMTLVALLVVVPRARRDDKRERKKDVVVR
jgi:zinc transporter ZupT